MSEQEINARIERNRNEIDKVLSCPNLDFVYMRVRMLAAQNEKLISQLKDMNVPQSTKSKRHDFE